MNKAETAKIVGVLMGYYPDTFTNMNDEENEMFVQIWQKSFEDEPYESVSLAVWDYIQNSTDEYMPRVGKIKAIITEHRFESVPNEIEAFEILIRARKKFNIYATSSDDGSYSTLPDAIKRAIGGKQGFISIGFLDTESESYSIEKTRFMKQYRSEIEKQKRDSNRPMWLAEAISERALRLDNGSSGNVKAITDGN